MWDKLLLGIEILLQGMAGIFVVAFVIILLIFALNKVTNRVNSDTNPESQDS